MTPVRAEADASNSSATKRTVPVSSRVSLRGLGFEEPQEMDEGARPAVCAAAADFLPETGYSSIAPLFSPPG
jgi:hypothetical protein